MDGYLRRLVKRSGVPSRMLPVIRSTSPIAEEDQRLGIRGVNAVPPMPAPIQPDLQDRVGSLQVSTQSEALSTKSVPERNIAKLTTSNTGFASHPGARQHEHSLTAPNAATVVSSTDNEASSTIDEDTSGNISQDYLEMPSRRGSFSAELKVPDAAGTPDVEGRSIRNHGNVAGHGTAYVRSEQTPSRPTSIAPASPTSPRSEPLSDDRNNFAEGPRVVIGNINVEVIPPAEAGPKVERHPSKPMTAESASVIGSLSGNIRESRRLNLRYR
jgi:hypothetical protein